MRRWRRLSLGVLATLLLGGSLAVRPARAQQTTAELRWLRYGQSYVRLNIQSGRVAVNVLRPGGFMSPQSTDARGRKEQLTIQYNYNTGVADVNYRLAGPEEALTVTAASGGRVVVRREPGAKSDAVPSEFLQEPGQPLKLTFGKDAAKKTFSAPTFWHLLLAERDACQKYVLPGLYFFRSDQDLLTKADQVERELLRVARSGKLPDQRRWAELVAQLADDHYARREAADRQLRALGPAVVAYLQGLDRRKLDPEQQYRIHRIIRALSSATGEETPEQVAAMMLADPAIWLVLLDREPKETRELAAKHLARLLGGPIDYSPAADPPTRQRQIEAIRRRIGEK